MARKMSRELEVNGAVDQGGPEDQEALKIPTNFRITKMTAEKFRKVAAEFSNQDYALNAMLAAYERLELKKNLPAYAKEIEAFQQYTDLLVAKFINVLSNYNSIEERARGEVGKLLETKDANIKDLENVIGEMRGSVKERDEAVSRALAAEHQVVKLENENKMLTAEKEKQRQMYDSSVNDKEKINQTLRDQIDALEKQIQNFSELSEQLQSLREELENKKQELKDQSYQHQLSDVEKEKILNSEMEELRREHREALEALRNKYDEREQRLQEHYEKRIDSILQSGNAKEEPVSAKK